MTRIIISSLVIISTISFSSCKKVAEEPATKSSMEGTWAVVEAYDDRDSSIIDKINFPITAFHLSSDNTVISTAGPMMMHTVYGGNKYTEIASKVDQVFNYASLDVTGGEFFLGGGVQETFTLEMKLEGLPGQKALTDLLDLIGITNDYLDLVVYHKFLDVKVSFDDGPDGDDYDNRDIMYWEFNDNTTAVYNTKDNTGNYVLWGGWSVDNFTKGRFVLERKSKDLETLVQEAL
jgi:hypothetical protein